MKVKMLRLRARLRRSVKKFMDSPDHSQNTLVENNTPLEDFLPTKINNLYEAYAYFCKKYGSKKAFLNPETTYQEVFQQMLSRAAFMQKEGLGKGDNIALLARNSAEWAVTYMAITAIGARALVLDFNLKSEVLPEMLALVKTKAIFLDPEFDHDFPGVKKYFVDLKQNMSEAKSFKETNIGPEDGASLLFTSGTTSNPKVVELTHKNIYGTSFGAIHFLGRGENNNFLCILPFYHVYGFVAGFMGPLCAGYSLVFQASLKSTELLETLNKYSIQYFPCVPQILETFLDKILKKVRDESKLKYKLFIFLLENAPSLRQLGLGPVLDKIFAPARKVFGKDFKYFVSGGARLGRKSFLYFQRMGFTIVEGYGLTETVGPIVANIPEKTKPICVGSPLPGISIQIRNINREGIGEIWAKGISIMRGYYQNPDLNDTIFDRDGWFNTGDLGFLDKDKQLHIRGRKKNVIVLDSGKNVYPEELEGYYLQSELIQEVAIFGKRINGKEVVYAVIFAKDENTTYADLKAELKRMNVGLPTYKAIGQFALSKQLLPRTTTQKIVIREVIKNLEAGQYITA
jgi:long-chain acyl-CoA synthetase